MGTCPCPAGPPPEKLSNGPPGTRRSPTNTALAWIRGYMDLHAGPLSISETIQRTKPNTSTNANHLPRRANSPSFFKEKRGAVEWFCAKKDVSGCTRSLRYKVRRQYVGV